MKRHFTIGIYFLIYVHWAISASIPVKRGMDDEDRAVLAELNNARKAAAEQHQIANMHEMVYDENLERRTQQLTCGSEPSDAMAIPFPSQEEMAKVEKMSEEERKQAQGGMTSLLVYAMTVLSNPEQSRIGCGMVDLQCSLPGVNGPAVPLSGIVCLVGPKSSISKADIKHGPPGSQCPNGKASSELCKSLSGGSGGFGTGKRWKELADEEQKIQKEKFEKKMGHGAESSWEGLKKEKTTDQILRLSLHYS
ncbi:unnamed protein product [Caenorhabditis nigoni]